MDMQSDIHSHQNLTPTDIAFAIVKNTLWHVGVASDAERCAEWLIKRLVRTGITGLTLLAAVREFAASVNEKFGPKTLPEWRARQLIPPLLLKDARETQDEPVLLPPADLGTRLSDVTAKQVTWLWPGRIPLGMLTTLDGDPGTGKTLLALMIAACITQGGYFPDNEFAPFDSNVIVISMEDDLAATIKPRLVAVGADLDRVISLAMVPDTDSAGNPLVDSEGNPLQRPFLLPRDLNLLEHAIKQHEAKLVIIDPVMGCLDGTVDANKDQDVRTKVATPLKVLAEQTGCAILLIRHLSKTGGGNNAIYRGGGSIAWIGAARAGLMAIRDPDDDTRCVLAMAKCNLAEMPVSWSYRVVGRPIQTEAGSCSVGQIEWIGKSEHTAASLMRAQQLHERETHHLADRSRRVLEFVRGAKPEPVTVADVTKATGIPDDQAKVYLNRLAEYGYVKKGGRGQFYVPLTDAERAEREAGTSVTNRHDCYRVTSVTCVTDSNDSPMLEPRAGAEGNTGNTRNKGNTGNTSNTLSEGQDVPAAA